MEMCNWSSYLINGQEYNANLYDYLSRSGKRIYCHSADDNHNGKPFDAPGCDSFGGFTMIMAEELTYPAVIGALEKGDFYSSMGPVINHFAIEDGKIKVECDGAREIIIHLGSRKTLRAHGTVDEPLFFAEFDMPERYRYIRLAVVDFEGKHADTRAIFPEEIV